MDIIVHLQPFVVEIPDGLESNEEVERHLRDEVIPKRCKDKTISLEGFEPNYRYFDQQ